MRALWQNACLDKVMAIKIIGATFTYISLTSNYHVVPGKHSQAILFLNGLYSKLLYRGTSTTAFHYLSVSHQSGRLATSCSWQPFLEKLCFAGFGCIHCAAWQGKVLPVTQALAVYSTFVSCYFSGPRIFIHPRDGKQSLNTSNDLENKKEGLLCKLYINVVRTSNVSSANVGLLELPVCPQSQSQALALSSPRGFLLR